MGDPRYPFNIDEVVKAAAKNNKVIEVNNSSPQSRPGSENICLEILKKCKECGVKIAVNSDAHFWGMVGNFTSSLSLIEKVDYPKELVINSSVDNLEAYFNSRPNKKRISF